MKIQNEDVGFEPAEMDDVRVREMERERENEKSRRDKE